MKTPDFLGYTGTRAIITGGSSGIGRSIAIALANHGANVVIVGRNEVELTRTVEYCRSSNWPDAKIHYVIADLSLEASPETVVEKSCTLLGGVDLLVNAAAIVHREQSNEEITSVDTWNEIISTNLRSPYLLSKFARTHLASSHGSIVNISSIWAHIGAKKQVAYSTSKAAMVELTRSLALDLAQDGIRVNCVCPGTVKTPLLYRGRDSFDERATANLYPLGRIGTPEDIASAVLFLGSNKASGWTTGTVLTVDGGYTIQ